jgi:hypothetical protein
MAQLHKALHMQRVVIVTPSVYGTDNSATLWGMKARGNNARGIAVIDDKTAESELDAMARAGIRGIRINLATGAADARPGGRAQTLPGRRRAHEGARLHIQMYVHPAGDLLDQGARGFAGAGGVRPFAAPSRRSASPSRASRPGRVASLRQGPTSRSRARTRVDQGPDFAVRGAAARALIRGESDAQSSGHRLAPSELSQPKAGPRTAGCASLRLDRHDGRLLNQASHLGRPMRAMRKQILVDHPANASLRRFRRDRVLHR